MANGLRWDNVATSALFQREDLALAELRESSSLAEDTYCYNSYPASYPDPCTYRDEPCLSPRDEVANETYAPSKSGITSVANRFIVS